jgi:hypothetical protein
MEGDKGWWAVRGEIMARDWERCLMEEEQECRGRKRRVLNLWLWCVFLSSLYNSSLAI